MSPATAHIAGLQADGRLLMRHVAQRADRSVGTEPRPPLADTDLALLHAAPEQVVAEHASGRLARCLDELSHRAAPATISTIRLTSAYLGAPADEDRDTSVTRRALRLKLVFGSIFLAAIAVTIATVLLLWHVDSGRRTTQLLDEVNAQLRTSFAALGKLNDASWIPAPPAERVANAVQAAGERAQYFVPFCDGAERAPDQAAWAPEARKAGWTPPLTGFRSPAASVDGFHAQEACSRWREARVREELVFFRLRQWNCDSQRILSAFTAACAIGQEVASPEFDKHWQRTEIRTAAMISGLSGFVLPLALGFIGAAAYVLRRLDRKLASFTVAENDATHAVLRVLLGTMLGGLLGVVWNGDKPVELGGFTLSLAALAFFVGFSLEVVFSTIERLVDAVTSKLRGA